MEHPEREPIDAAAFIDALERHAGGTAGPVRAKGRIVSPCGGVKAWFSGARYAFVEEYASWVEADGCELSLTPRWSEEPFRIEALGQVVELDFRDVRLATAERYRADYDSPRDAPEPVPDLFERGATKATVREFGFYPGEEAWIAIRKERFMLPPPRPDAPPRERVRSLLLLAATEADLARSSELLTPGYRRWSY
jgi:hypothetical protein